jgi:hypothetical protein
MLLGLIGGIIAYFLIRKHDPSRAKWCIVAGFIFSVMWLFVFVAVIVAMTPPEPVTPVQAAVENGIDFENPELSNGVHGHAPESSNEGKNQLNSQEAIKKTMESIRERAQTVGKAITKPFRG